MVKVGEVCRCALVSKQNHAKTRDSRIVNTNRHFARLLFATITPPPLVSTFLLLIVQTKRVKIILKAVDTEHRSSSKERKAHDGKKEN